MIELTIKNTKPLQKKQKKKKTSTGGLTVALFQLSPWDVVSSPLAVKVEFRIFSAILYDSKRNKWHRLSLQSLQASSLFRPICFSGKNK